jgi:mannitol/fructose-specific phosphotransferase system IIA component (Ntr-type)
MLLKELLPAEMIRVDMDGLDKWTAIERLADLLAENGKAADRAALVDAILGRERQGSTGLGKGIAVPHARTDAVDEVVATLGIAGAGIDFESPDEQPCHLVFLIAAPAHESARYLEALAAVAALGERPKRVSRLAAATSPDAAAAILKGTAVEPD